MLIFRTLVILTVPSSISNRPGTILTLTPALIADVDDPADILRGRVGDGDDDFVHRQLPRQAEDPVRVADDFHALDHGMEFGRIVVDKAEDDHPQIRPLL